MDLNARKGLESLLAEHANAEMDLVRAKNRRHDAYHALVNYVDKLTAAVREEGIAEQKVKGWDETAQACGFEGTTEALGYLLTEKQQNCKCAQVPCEDALPVGKAQDVTWNNTVEEYGKTAALAVDFASRRIAEVLAPDPQRADVPVGTLATLPITLTSEQVANGMRHGDADVKIPYDFCPCGTCGTARLILGPSDDRKQFAHSPATVEQFGAFIDCPCKACCEWRTLAGVGKDKPEASMIVAPSYAEEIPLLPA